MTYLLNHSLLKPQLRHLNLSLSLRHPHSQRLCLLRVLVRLHLQI